MKNGEKNIGGKDDWNIITFNTFVTFVSPLSSLLCSPPSSKHRNDRISNWFLFYFHHPKKSISSLISTSGLWPKMIWIACASRINVHVLKQVG